MKQIQLNKKQIIGVAGLVLATFLMLFTNKILRKIR